MSKFKMLLAAAVLLALVVLMLATSRVSAGDNTGGQGHGIIRALLM